LNVALKTYSHINKKRCKYTSDLIGVSTQGEAGILIILHGPEIAGSGYEIDFSCKTLVLEGTAILNSIDYIDYQNIHMVALISS